MNNEIGSYDAKTRLPEILRRVESGETFTITNRGRPVAELIPVRDAERGRARASVAAIQAMMKTPITHVHLSEEQYQEHREQGRR